MFENRFYANSDHLLYWRRTKVPQTVRRLFIENGKLCRRFLAHDGTFLYNQLCVPNSILQQIMYRTHNSPSGGHFWKYVKIRQNQKKILSPELCGIRCRLFQKLFHQPANETRTPLETENTNTSGFDIETFARQLYADRHYGTIPIVTIQVPADRYWCFH